MLGIASDSVSRALRHETGTKSKGVTEKYVGSISADITNLKSELVYKDPKAANFAAEGLTSIPRTSAEIDAWCEKNGKDKKVRKSRVYASNH